MAVKVARKKYHEDFCFCCGTGGSLLECNDCPKVRANFDLIAAATATATATAAAAAMLMLPPQLRSVDTNTDHNINVN